MNSSLVHLIRQSAAHNKAASAKLIKIFQPLLLSLSYKLNKEDTYQDLAEFLLVLVPKIPPTINSDGAIFKYIHTSLVHKLYELYKKSAKEHLEVSANTYLDIKSDPHDDYRTIENHLLVCEIFKELSTNDKNLLIERFYSEITVKEMSAKHKVSPQAIYKRYKSILKKIKNNSSYCS